MYSRAGWLKRKTVAVKSCTVTPGYLWTIFCYYSFQEKRKTLFLIAAGKRNWASLWLKAIPFQRDPFLASFRMEEAKSVSAPRSPLSIIYKYNILFLKKNHSWIKYMNRNHAIKSFICNIYIAIHQRPWLWAITNRNDKIGTLKMINN